MRFLTRRNIGAIVGLVLIVAAGAFAYWKQLLNTPLSIKEPMVYEVRQGMGANQVVAQLQASGVLAKVWPLKIWLKLNPDKAAVKAGEYQIPVGVNACELMALLVSGNTVHYQVTLPEGLRFSEALAILQQQDKLTIQSTEMSYPEIMQYVTGRPLSEVPHHEGQFFPDTYQFYKGVSDLQILKRAYDKMQRVLDEEWQQVDPEAQPYDNAYQVLIMASIIEKETGVAYERPRIAGVFVQRLQQRMRLQTDPTVIYGLGDRYQGNITRRHLQEKTAYNTYRINGLPPTPIALPGREAIHAALHPLKDGSLYFVARGDGSHEFSSNLEAHNRAVRRYQIDKRKKNYQSAPTTQN